MEDLKFNVFAMISPKTPSEYIAVLDESLRIASDLGDQIDADTAYLERVNDVAISA